MFFLFFFLGLVDFTTFFMVHGTFVRSLEHPGVILVVLGPKWGFVALVWSSRWPSIAAWRDLSYAKELEDDVVSPRVFPQVSSFTVVRTAY